jgi:hypothetical protein
LVRVCDISELSLVPSVSMQSKRLLASATSCYKMITTCSRLFNTTGNKQCKHILFTSCEIFTWAIQYIYGIQNLMFHLGLALHPVATSHTQVLRYGISIPQHIYTAHLIEKATIYYLVTKSMTTNHNGFLPARHQSWNRFTNDWFTEHSTTKDVPDCTIWTSPHLFQLKLCEAHKWFG